MKMLNEFHINELFEVMSNPQLNKKNFTFSEQAEYPYFTRTENNNGILGYVECFDEAHKIKGNSLAVGMISMKFHYMQHDFYAGQFTKTLIPKFQGFNEKLALYFIAILNKYSEYYQSYLVRDFNDKVSETVVSLPVIESSESNHKYTVDDIDWQNMQDYIAKLEQCRLTELDTYLKVTGLNDYTLTTEDKKLLSLSRKSAADQDSIMDADRQDGQVIFKKFSIDSLFEKTKLSHKRPFDKNKDTSNHKTAEFDLPLINAKIGDNGIMFYGRKTDFDYVDKSIDIIQNGIIATGKVYVQPQDTGVLWDGYLIKAKFDVDERCRRLFYLATCIQKAIQPLFNRENKATWERVKVCQIEVPVDSDGQIAFEYMENYVKAIEKVVIADVVKYKDQQINAARQLINK